MNTVIIFSTIFFCGGVGCKPVNSPFPLWIYLCFIRYADRSRSSLAFFFIVAGERGKNLCHTRHTILFYVLLRERVVYSLNTVDHVARYVSQWAISARVSRPSRVRRTMVTRTVEKRCVALQKLHTIARRGLSATDYYYYYYYRAKRTQGDCWRWNIIVTFCTVEISKRVLFPQSHARSTSAATRVRQNLHTHTHTFCRPREFYRFKQ